MTTESITDQNRSVINGFIMDHWYTTQMVLRGKIIDMTKVHGIACFENNVVIALITFIIYDDLLEITSLDSLREKQGTGTMLVEKAIQTAKAQGLKKVVVITTNDNINAIGFYQKRGFDMAKLYRNALDVSRNLKPEIPLIGENAIPLRHEIEFELIL